MARAGDFSTALHGDELVPNPHRCVGASATSTQCMQLACNRSNTKMSLDRCHLTIWNNCWLIYHQHHVQTQLGSGHCEIRERRINLVFLTVARPKFTWSSGAQKYGLRPYEDAEKEFENSSKVHASPASSSNSSACGREARVEGHESCWNTFRCIECLAAVREQVACTSGAATLRCGLSHPPTASTIAPMNLSQSKVNCLPIQCHSCC